MADDPPNTLSMWTIYDRPLDIPDKIVARRFIIGHGVATATPDKIVGDTLDEVRAQLPQGVYCLPRDPADESHIIEVWL